MKQLPLTKQQLTAAPISLSLGRVAQAALTINGGSSSESSARVSWGGADSLSEARSIMYKARLLYTPDAADELTRLVLESRAADEEK